ncbi:MAG: VCBS repeat-containing protein [Polyangiaceae bacterium]|nr:VCBS repeat-containing protein [Polyangiaceae bacterium]
MRHYLAFSLVLSVPALALGQPVEKWQAGGCKNGYCDTGWYASPAVVDLDGDGNMEVVWGGYDLVALEGATGKEIWRGPNGQRIWPSPAVADLTGDGSLEVVVGRGGDQVTVYSASGTELWTRHPFGAGEVRTLALGDLDGNGSIEIVVGRASGGEVEQVSVYEPDGSVRSGFPARHADDPGYGWGLYNQNVALGDLDGDSELEIYVPTDTHYILAVHPDGEQLAVNAMYGAGKVWSQVGVHVDQAADLRGYAECGTEHRPNFANSAPVIADVDGNGSDEFIVVGDVYDCSVGDPDGDLYHTPFILNMDRTRWSGSGYDWQTIPVPGAGSGPLSQDYAVIQYCVTSAAVADLDNDGEKEILYPSYDGKLHAVWLDRTAHGSWPFTLPTDGGIHFASEPAVVDLEGDGPAEVIFTSWPENGGDRVGRLYILDAYGHLLESVDLPAPLGDDWNGSLGAPTVANIDADPDLEIVIGTTASGAVAYDLPGSAGARILWGTSRGSLMRSGRASAVGSATNNGGAAGSDGAGGSTATGGADDTGGTSAAGGNAHSGGGGDGGGTGGRAHTGGAGAAGGTGGTGGTGNTAPSHDAGGPSGTAGTGDPAASAAGTDGAGPETGTAGTGAVRSDADDDDTAHDDTTDDDTTDDDTTDDDTTDDDTTDDDTADDDTADDGAGDDTANNGGAAGSGAVRSESRSRDDGCSCGVAGAPHEEAWALGLFALAWIGLRGRNRGRRCARVARS